MGVYMIMQATHLIYITAFAIYIADSQAENCEQGAECIKANDCPYFVERKNRLVELRKQPGKESESKNLLASLQQMVCNKSKKRVCCKKFSELPNYQKHECGIALTSSKVVGGENTQLGEFPWMALLGTAYENDIKWRCGGSIINELYILSAAHCNDPDIIRVGEWKVDDEEVDCVESVGRKVCAEKPQDISVQCVFRHPEYKKLLIGRLPINDIMLVRVQRPITYTNFVAPVCLPAGDLAVTYENFAESRDERIETLLVVGWGKTQTDFDFNKTDAIPSADQKKLQLPEMSHQMCVEAFGTSDIRFEKHLCAGGEQGKDSCRGDSGGPLLMQKNGDSPFLQLGVVSSGTFHCGRGYPTIFTRVTEFMDWIIDIVNQ